MAKKLEKYQVFFCCKSNINITTFNYFIDIIGNITFDWSNIIHEISIWSTKGERHTITDMVWTHWPICCPACYRINLSNYFKKKHIVPKQIFIYVSKQNNLKISFYLEDNNIALNKRPLKTSMLDYTGPDISSPDLNKPRIERVIVKMAQLIDSELDKDKDCVNYPTETFASYADCDEKYVYNQFATKYKGRVKKK